MARFLILFILVFISDNLFAAGISVKSVSYSPMDKSLATLIGLNDDSSIRRISLRDCRVIDDLPLDKGTAIAVIAEYVPSYIISGASGSLNMTNMITRKKSWSDTSYTKPVNIISQDETGEYIAAADTLTVVLYRFGKDSLIELFRKEFTGGVVAAQPDKENNRLFTAERAGVISTWSFDGKLLKSVDLAMPIAGMLIDNTRGRVLVYGKKGLFSLAKDTLVPTLILKGDITHADIDGAKNRLVVADIKGLTIYDNTKIAPILRVASGSGRAHVAKGGNFIATLSGRLIKLYDITRGSDIAVITMLDRGVTFSSSITDNPKNACALVSSMVSGVYLPGGADVASSMAPAIGQVADKAVVDDVRMPKVSDTFEIPEPKEPEPFIVEFKTNTSKPTQVAKPSNTKAPADVSVSTVKQLTPIDKMFEGGVPSWVANRKNQPPYNAVKSAGSVDEALTLARKQIKDELAKNLIRRMVDMQDVKAIEDIELKKRFLWMAASSAANSLNNDILTIDSWVSPAGQVFIRAKVNEKSIDPAFMKSYTEELSILKEAPDNYLMRTPNIIK